MLDDLIKMLQAGQGQVSPEMQRQLAELPGFEPYIQDSMVQGQSPGGPPSSLGVGRDRATVYPSSATPSQPASSGPPATPAQGNGIGFIGTLLSAVPGTVGNIGKMLVQQDAKGRAQAVSARNQNQIYQLLVSSGVPADQAAVLSRDSKESTKFIRELQKQRMQGPNVTTIKDQFGNDVSARYDPQSGRYVPLQGAVGAPAQSPAGPQQPQVTGSASPSVAVPAGVNPQKYMNERAKLLAKSGAERPKQEAAAKVKINELMTQSDVVLKNIDRALTLTNSSSIDRDTPILNTETGIGTTSGLIGAATSFIPGTDSHDLKMVLENIKANIGFDKLQAMREASPTGGALGQVSNFEVRQLQAVMGNLDQFQSLGQLQEALKTVRKIVQNRRESYLGAYKKDFNADYSPQGLNQTQAPPQAAPNPAPSAASPSVNAGVAGFAAPGLAQPSAPRSYTYVPGKGLVPKE